MKLPIVTRKKEFSWVLLQFYGFYKKDLNYLESFILDLFEKSDKCV